MPTFVDFGATESLASMFIVAFVAGMVGSAHCAAMCGPLVIGCAKSSGFGMLAVPVQQMGRGAAYAVLGGAAGHIGGSVDGFTATWLGWRAVPAVLGLLLVVLGIRTCIGEPQKSSTNRLLTASRDVIRSVSPRWRPVLLGAFSALLPCGLLHSMVLASAGSGSAVNGTIVMSGFFLGTAPPLVLIGFGARRIAARLGGGGGRWLEGIACIAAGAVLLVGAIARDGGSTCCGNGG